MRGIAQRHLTAAHRAGAAQQIEASPEVIGWRRVADPGACAVCLVLDDGTTHSDTTGFHTHPGCRCGAEPVMRGVNTRPPSKTGIDRLNAMTDRQLDTLFAGRGGPRVRELLRAGLIKPHELIRVRPRRPGQPVIIEQVPIRDLRILVLRRHFDPLLGVGVDIDPGELKMMLDWQSPGQGYGVAQALARGADPSSFTRSAVSHGKRMIAALTRAALRSTVPVDIKVYRGISDRTFLPAGAAVKGAEFSLDTGFAATSVFRSVAAEVFSTGGQGVVFDIDVPAGSHALWVSGIGDPRMRDEGELLFPPDTRVRSKGSRIGPDGTMVVFVEVIP